MRSRRRSRPLAAQGRDARADLRPLGADPRRCRHPHHDVDRGRRHRLDHLHHLPLPPALGAGGDDRPAALGPVRVHRDPLLRAELQHHVARRHRHRGRRAVRRGHRAHRERARAPRRMPRPARGDAAASSSTPARRWVADLLLAAAHHGELPAHLHARGAGRAALPPARLHQDLRDVRGRDPVDHAGAAADGAAAARALPHRGESRQSRPRTGSTARSRASSAARGWSWSRSRWS